ncbi:YopX family protein [Metaclostridioides mangenotii]|uniref:YopX family protein n=1 Tax=Metaclostridioides mangenotii TaxID=1540 RepID=UPI0026EABC11|nr:YopX family protein [Clostridioides mangenotii]
MRDIKFRGYAVEEMVNSQWLTGYGILSIDYVDNSEEYWLIDNTHETRVKKESIGQYTGLKDKNGVEIYEGDIVKACEGKLFEVKWYDNGFKYKYRFKRSYKDEGSWIETKFLEIGRETEDRRWGVEVVGNIFENPEMVEIKL